MEAAISSGLERFQNKDRSNKEQDATQLKFNQDRGIFGGV